MCLTNLLTTTAVSAEPLLASTLDVLHGQNLMASAADQCKSADCQWNASAGVCTDSDAAHCGDGEADWACRSPPPRPQCL